MLVYRLVPFLPLEVSHLEQVMTDLLGKRASRAVLAGHLGQLTWTSEVPMWLASKVNLPCTFGEELLLLGLYPNSVPGRIGRVINHEPPFFDQCTSISSVVGLKRLNESSSVQHQLPVPA